MKKVAIIGGGLSGLLTSIQLVRENIPVQLFEKRLYPFHRVCGEYISNETIPFLKSLNLYPEEFHPAQIKRFQLTSVNGKSVTLPLDLGGFGISRYSFDNWLCQKAIKVGVEVHQNAEVNKIHFQENQFTLSTNKKSFSSDVAVGSYGKRSLLDIKMNRSFIKKRSPYIGVKYHVRNEHANDLIALHNFKDGYCGISNVENGLSNLCYLSHRDNLKETGSIQALEEQILFKNSFLKNIFKNAEFVFVPPETINEISFETKRPVENHILMAGDAAGMITPLCGNGMAMAIHSSKILSGHIVHYCKNESTSRETLESSYTKQWQEQFAARLRVGRQLQHLFGSTFTSNLAVGLAQNFKPLAQHLISKSHGKPFS
ncbi:MAG: NAD(P)/FAD-dependent oxidoreductase [Cyclobacteriaceae bacterium]|nr:NAD(P)/FAD-dependent oxidoreductase [Cyclobacteriaceae bacterium]